MKKIGIVLAALVIATLLVGTASAAQTSFSVAVNDGTARVQTSFRSNTEGDVPPYDETGYDFNVFAIHADQFRMTHTVNTDDGIVEAEHGIGYSPAVYGLKRIFMDEKVTTARVAKGDNASVCCDSSAETRVNAYFLNYESVAVSENNQVLFAVNSAGAGKMDVLTTENKLIGDVNGTWTEAYSNDKLSVNGLWNVSAEFMSDECDRPPLAPEIKDILCPFYP